ncbi:MAG: class I SAM-dependent methyltransferase [Steroidobacteraceae bacterium]
MQIATGADAPIHAEPELIEQRLRLDGARILELGCGRAQLTRLLATAGAGRSVLALEVDAIQHDLNLAITDLPNVRFELGGAEAVPAGDDSFDAVFMFKSLHHVPPAQMPTALAEIRRVLKPGGHAWISEPVFAGDFNEILRLFHDESRVRQLAFDAVRAAVDSGALQLVEQIFFRAPVAFSDFAEFEKMVIGVTHTQHRLTPEVRAEVRRRFESHLTDGGAHFGQPMRIDLLRKP